MRYNYSKQVAKPAPAAVMHVQNDGPVLKASNYWDGPLAASGYAYLSVNCGALRLLVPDDGIGGEGVTAILEGVTHVAVTKGFSVQHGREMVQILLDDGSPRPFFLELCLEQLDRNVAPDDQERRFFVYTSGPRLVADLPCRIKRGAIA